MSALAVYALAALTVYVLLRRMKPHDIAWPFAWSMVWPVMLAIVLVVLAQEIASKRAARRKP